MPPTCSSPPKDPEKQCRSRLLGLAALVDASSASAKPILVQAQVW